MRAEAKRSVPSADAARTRPERASRDVGAPPHRDSEEGCRLRRDSTRLPGNHSGARNAVQPKERRGALPSNEASAEGTHRVVAQYKQRWP